MKKTATMKKDEKNSLLKQQEEQLTTNKLINE